MKKNINGIGYNKSRAKLVAKSKTEHAAEARLTNRKTNAVKAIVIGSAALSVAALGFFAFKSYKKKKKNILSLWN